AHARVIAARCGARPALAAPRPPCFASRMRRLTALLALPFVLAACSSTSLNSVYRDPNFSGGPFRKLIVIGLGASAGGRAQFENAVAANLAARDVLAVASGNLIASMGDVTRAAVREWVQTDGYDAVIVTRLVDTQKQTSYKPPTYTDFYGYWGSYGSY